MRATPAARAYAAAKPTRTFHFTLGTDRGAVHLALCAAGLNGNTVRRMGVRELESTLRWAVLDGRLTEEDAARACVGIAPQLAPVGPARGEAPEATPWHVHLFNYDAARPGLCACGARYEEVRGA